MEVNYGLSKIEILRVYSAKGLILFRVNVGALLRPDTSLQNAHIYERLFSRHTVAAQLQAAATIQKLHFWSLNYLLKIK